MGGAKDIWKNSTSSGTTQKFNDQSSSDGKIEFVSFAGSISIGM
jgi:hypothetical protein